MRQKLRVDFIDHPSGTGYVVTLNGRPVLHPFPNAAGVLAYARNLGTYARYAGTAPDRLAAEGARFMSGDENTVA